MAAGIKVTIDLDESQAIRALKSLNDQLGKTGKETDKLNEKSSRFKDSFLGNLAAIAAVKAFQFIRQELSDSLAKFQEFEQGLVNVAKTANLTDKEVDQLSSNIIKISKVVPASTKELLDIATAAGQLGVKSTKDITKFTETIAKLGRVSNLSGDDAATVLTRILNVTGEGIGTIDTFASVIVSLGNNFAATESEIALVTNEVARATAQFGVGAGEAAALSAVLRSVGVRAEEAGGVLSKAFLQINNSIQEGGSRLEELQKITGLSGEEIKKQFGENAIGFFRNFVNGLNDAEGGIKNASNNLARLGIDGIRVQKVLPVLAQNVGELDRALGLYNAELGDSVALNQEFDKAIDTSRSKTDLLQNAIDRASVRIGEKLAAALERVAPLLIDIADQVGTTNFTRFAEASNDVEALNIQLEKQKNFLKGIKEGSLSVRDVGIPTGEIEDNIKSLRSRIAELNEEGSKNTLKDLRAELEKLNQADPLLPSIFGNAGDLQERKDTLLAQIKNLEQQAVLEGKAIVEEGEKDKTNIATEGELTRQSILSELRAAKREEDRAIAEEDKLQKQLAAEDDLAFITENLGKETAAKELARIKDIDDEKKRNEELVKLRRKATEESKASLLDLTKFENMTNTQKVAAQRDTLQTISGLTNSNNDALFAVGKASSLALAGINVAEGVTKALAAFPPPFNFAAAAAVGAAGAVNIAQIASAKKPSAGNFQDGGIIGGNSFSGDNLTANVNSGEAVFNRRQQENLFKAVDGGNLGGGSSVVINNPVLLEQGAVDALIDQINDAIEFRNKDLRTA